MNQKISTPIAMGIILASSLLAFGFIYWQYLNFQRNLSVQSEINFNGDKAHEEVCFKGTLKGYYPQEVPFVDEIPAELKKVIIRQITEDVEEKIGFSKAEFCKAENIALSGIKADLNRDGNSEYITFTENILQSDGNLYIPGGTGGSPGYIFGLIQNKWKSIGDFRFAGSIYTFNVVESRWTKGYVNLAVVDYCGGGGVISEYAWDGETYKLIKNTQWGPETQYPKGPPEEYWELFEGRG